MRSKSETDPSSSEPPGLAAASAALPARRSVTVDPRHQQAVHVWAEAQAASGARKLELLRAAARLERAALENTKQQAERALIAELGARSAFLACDFREAASIARLAVSDDDSAIQWDLRRVRAQALVLDGFARMLLDSVLSWTAGAGEAPDLELRCGARSVEITFDPDLSDLREEPLTAAALKLEVPLEPDVDELLARISAWLTRTEVLWLGPGGDARTPVFAAAA